MEKKLVQFLLTCCILLLGLSTRLDAHVSQEDAFHFEVQTSSFSPSTSQLHTVHKAFRLEVRLIEVKENEEKRRIHMASGKPQESRNSAAHPVCTSPTETYFHSPRNRWCLSGQLHPSPSCNSLNIVFCVFRN